VRRIAFFIPSLTSIQDIYLTVLRGFNFLVGVRANSWSLSVQSRGGYCVVAREGTTIRADGYLSPQDDYCKCTDPSS
jgi:hypothetical protein